MENYRVEYLTPEETLARMERSARAFGRTLDEDVAWWCDFWVEHGCPENAEALRDTVRELRDLTANARQAQMDHTRDASELPSI